MPAEGWMTIAVRAELYTEMQELAGALDRPINWVASKAIEHAVRRCLESRPGAIPPWEFNKKAAEEIGLR